LRIKTLLFGAGLGSKEFKQNTKDSRECLAFIDNDIKRHYTKFEDILIIPPSDIENYNYDEIVITTQWVEEVKTQLIEELKINPKKILIAKKSLLKKPQPFQDTDTIKLARKIIKTLSFEAIQDNIPLCVDFGTLLGLTREKDIILWDDDIDFALDVSLMQTFDDWIKKTIYKVDKDIDWIVEKQIDRYDQVLSIQITFVNENFNSFITSITSRKNDENNNSIHLASLGKWYAPAKHFKTLEILRWNDENIQVPSNYKEYLTFLYGDWQTPNKNMTMDDYQNIGEVSFEDFNDAKIKMTKVTKND